MAFVDTCRALGRRRIDISKRVRSPEDWERLWPKPRHSYPFTWGDCWKAVAEFGVADFPAELGFYLDVLGMRVNAMWEDHAMIMSPDGAYAFTVYRAKRTSPGVNLQFMLGNIASAAKAVERRGADIVQGLTTEWGEDNPMRTFKLRTPSGLMITLWGFVAANEKTRAAKGARARKR